MSVKTMMIVAAFWCACAWPQTAKLTINDATPEGKLLTRIGQEQDGAAKLKLMEEFASQYPSDRSAAWVYGQMEEAYLKAGQFDKAIAAGEKGLAAQPDDVVISYNMLKAAEGKNDPDLVIKYASQTSDLARKTVASPQPSDAAEVDAWKSRVDFAKQTDIYTEYSLFATAAKSQNPQKTVQLVDTLMARNPQSQYLAQAYGPYFAALRQTGQMDKAGQMAEQALAKDPKNDQLLLLAAEYHQQKKDSLDKVMDYSTRLTQVMGSKEKPQGVSDADWENRKKATLAAGYWMAGVAAHDKGDMAAADKNLRAALPLVQGNDQMLASTLFYLGVANFKLGQASKNRAQMSEAAKFSQQAAAMNSPFKETAAKNLKGIQAALAQGRATKK